MKYFSFAIAKMNCRQNSLLYLKNSLSHCFYIFVPFPNYVLFFATYIIGLFHKTTFMELPQSNTQTPVYSYTRTELLSLRTKTSLLSLSTVDRLKDLNIGYHLPSRHRSSGGAKRKKQNLHPFIVASFNAQSVRGNDMACVRCELSTFMKDNGVNLLL